MVRQNENNGILTSEEREVLEGIHLGEGGRLSPPLEIFLRLALKEEVKRLTKKGDGGSESFTDQGQRSNRVPKGTW